MKRNMKKGGVLFHTWEEVAAGRDNWHGMLRERCWPLRRSASKNTRERTTKGALPRQVTSFNGLFTRGTAIPERDYRPP